jgi:hypothetical protein
MPRVTDDPNLPHEQAAASWAAQSGSWQFDGATATYSPLEDPEKRNFSSASLSDLRFTEGWLRAEIEIGDEPSGASLGFGWEPNGGHYVAGVGGATAGYFVSDWTDTGYRDVATFGPRNSLKAGTYNVLVYVFGQQVLLEVNGVTVIARALPHPLVGNQVSVFAWGESEVRIKDLTVGTQRPQAFVVMQFGEPYDSLYTDVIHPVATAYGYAVQRADDVYGPGVILQDIVNGILQATVVIAEITPTNANVFYELGYSHALGKPTVLLAERETKLPFDVSSYRCVFYDNSIGGKQTVERDLRRHLTAIATSSVVGPAA